MEHYSELAKIIEEYEHSITWVLTTYSKNNIPPKKLTNAIQSYGNSIEKENVLGLIDTTVLGSAKEGIIFTNAGICIKEPFTKSVYISYDDIERVSVFDVDKDNDSDKILEIKLKGTESIKITSNFYRKTPFKELLDEIIKLRDKGKVSKTDKFIALEYMNDMVKKNYLKAIVTFIDLNEGVKNKQISELYSLMTQIKVNMNLRQYIIKYLSEENKDINYILDKLDENIENPTNNILHFSLIKDLLRIAKCTDDKLGDRQNEFINNITTKYNISKEQVNFINEAIILDKKILSGEVKDSEIISGMKDLAANAGAVGVPVVAVYLSGSVVGLSAAGITSGLAALGLGGVLGLSSMVTGIGVAILIGVGAYKGIRWITGGSERDKIKQREFLIQEAIKNNQETINNLVEDINTITLTVVELLKDVDKNKLKIDKLSKEISIFNEVFSTLREKGIGFEKVLYAEE